MKARCLIIIVFVLLQHLVNKSQAQFVYSEKEEAIQNAILDLSDPKSQIITNAPVNGILNWLKVCQVFVNFETTSQVLSLDSVLNEMEYHKKAIENLNDENPYYHYCLADINLMICYLHFKNKSVLQAMSNYLSAKNQATINEKKYPDFSLNLKHRLILKATDYWINETFFAKEVGSNHFWKNEFQSLLAEAKNHQKIGSGNYREIDLVGYCLQIIFGNLSPEEESNTVLSGDNLLKGPLESFAISMIYGKEEQFTRRLKILTHADSLGYMDRFNSLNLWYGIALLNNSDPISIKYLKAFIKNQKNNKQVNYCQLKLAWYYVATHQQTIADSLISVIRKTKQTDVWDDQQASYEVVHASDWVPEIIQSRLYFDGGNYSASINILLTLKNSVNSFTKHQKLEYAYRLARAYHKLGEANKAETFYQMAINSKLDTEFYYPAYSAFYLGELYESNKNIKNAVTWYNKCIQLDSPIYKVDIHNRAKLAKARLE